MEDAAAIDEQPVEARLEGCGLRIMRAVAGDIGGDRAQFRQLPFPRRLIGRDPFRGQRLEAGRPVAIEAGAAEAGRAEIVEQGELQRIGGVDMRDALQRRQRVRRLRHQREIALGPREGDAGKPERLFHNRAQRPDQGLDIVERRGRANARIAALRSPGRREAHLARRIVDQLFRRAQHLLDDQHGLPFPPDPFDRHPESRVETEIIILGGGRVHGRSLSRGGSDGKPTAFAARLGRR
jgi:hypothetical protein